MEASHFLLAVVRCDVPISKLTTDLATLCYAAQRILGACLWCSGLPQLWPVTLQVVLSLPFFTLFTLEWVISENSCGFSFSLNSNFSLLILRLWEWCGGQEINWFVKFMHQCTKLRLSYSLWWVNGGFFTKGVTRLDFHFRQITLQALQKMDLKRKILESREVNDKGIQYYRPGCEGPSQGVSKTVFCKGSNSTYFRHCGWCGLSCNYSTLPLLLNM